MKKNSTFLLIMLVCKLSIASIGDSCQNPYVLTSTSGTIATSTGALGISNTISSDCGAGTGPEFIYTYPNVPANHVVTFWTTNDNFDVVLYGKYGNCTSGSSIGCTDNDGRRLQWTNTTGSAQDVYFYVDGYSSTSYGNLDFHYSVSIPDSGNSCQNAYILNSTSGTIATNTGALGISNTISSDCGAGTGPEFIYTYPDVPANHVVTFWTTNDNFDVVLYGKYGNCTSGSSIGCTDTDGRRLQWTNTTGSAQDVYFYVDGYSSTSYGNLDFHYSVSIPDSGNSCQNAYILNSTSGTIATNTGALRISNTISSNCGAGTGPEFIYIYPYVPANHIVTFWTTNDNFDVVLYGKYGNCISGSSIGCTDTDGDTLKWTNTTGSAQDVYFYVDGYSSTSYGNLDFNYNISGTTSLVEEISQTKIKLFPNPTSSIINVLFEDEILNDLSIRLFNSLGEDLTPSLLVGNSQNKISIDVESLPSGVYYLIDNRNKINKSFIKN